MMTLEKFEEASELVKKVTNPTKLIYSEYLSAQTGAKVYLKPENMQHTGAYKIRGAYYKISTLTDEERSRGDLYELDLTLRNNITTEEHPLGVYHPHAKLHHIKKENIGLIEVMGLAVLPARLKGEMELLKDYILTGKDIRSNEQIAKHADWVDEFLPNYTSITEENVEEILQQEVGKVFCEVLEDAGVYKCNEKGLEAFHRFLDVL